MTYVNIYLHNKEGKSTFTRSLGLLVLNPFSFGLAPIDKNTVFS